MKILVTGATGYIGGQVAKRLFKEGNNVVCMTRRNRTVGSIPTVQGDLLESESLLKACRGVDVVCHCAGAMGKGLTDRTIHAVNVDGVKNMVLASKENGVKYFLHISAGGVTGPLGMTHADEKTTCYPYTVYEKTKYQGECLALSLARQLRIPLGVARPTFTYGPADPHKFIMFELIQKRLYFYVGDGLSTNHPVYIDDLINGILLMLKKKPDQEIYILGGPRPVSKKEWAITIANALQVPPPFLRFPVSLSWMGACLMEGMGEIFNVHVPLTKSRVLALSKCWGMDICKAQKDLGYYPQVDLAEGVVRTIDWYRKERWL